MAESDETFWVGGTIMHAPDRGGLEIVTDALVEIGPAGAIEAVFAPGSSDYAENRATAAASGRMLALSKDQYLLPGLVDLHIHAPQWPQMGKALHLPLSEWLLDDTFPLEASYRDIAFARRTYNSLVENLLANGTTTAVYFATVHLAASLLLAQICLDKGQRGLVGKVVMDDPDQCPDDYRDASTEEALRDTVRFIEDLRALPGNEGSLVSPVVTPRFVPSCTEATLEGLGAIAATYECHVQTHLSESDWEHGYVIDRLGRTDTEALDRFGLVTRRSIFAHANFMTGDDIDLIAGKGAGIAHCPLSNIYFANSVFPLRAALDRGLHVGLGTDIAGGGSPSIFDSCRHAISSSRMLEDGTDPAKPAAARGRPDSRIDFRDAFWLATAGGGEALDLKIGKFAPGYRFDAILVEANRPDSNLVIWEDLDTGDDALQKIIYNAGRQDIRKVWVDGRRVVDKDADVPSQSS